MDAKVIKQQIAYWEAQEKAAKTSIKSQEAQLKTIQQTIKALKSLLVKDEREEDTVGWDNGDYPGQSKREYDEVHGGS